MHIAGGGELASEGAAEGVRGVDDGAAPADSWQGWPGVEGVRTRAWAAYSSSREQSPCLIPGKAVTCIGCDVRLFKPTLGLTQQGKIIAQYAYLAIGAFTAIIVLDHVAISQTASIDF